MKKRLLLLFLCGILALPASAQIFISGDMFRQRVFNAKVTAVDATNDEPLGYASVYLKEKGDTVICNFTLTDNEGKAELKDITTGNYEFTVEFFGYKPFVKEIYFRKDEDLGTVRLEPDIRVLNAATVSATANPIEMKQDTVIYNAAAFRTLDNAMLKDLLKKMPGFEVGSDGTVKHNGEELKEITVGGKKFFLDDKAAALNNLPAHVVDKVKVIDRESETAQFTGIKDGDKEKVMDIELKKEYQQGFFGNLRLGAGTNLPGDKKDNPLTPDGKFLFNSNALLSAYSQKDQLTVVAGATNAQGEEGGGMLFISGGDDVDFSAYDSGLTTNYNIGANLSTERVKGMETTVSTNYSRTQAETRSLTDRTTFRGGAEDLLTHSGGNGRSVGNRVTLNLEMKNKDRSKYNFFLRPAFSYNINDSSSERSSESSTALSGLQNSSISSTGSLSRSLGGNVYAGAGISKLGKERRSLSLNFSASVSDSNGESREYSETFLAARGETDIRHLNYRSDGLKYSTYLALTYVEPLAERWAIQTVLSSRVEKSHSDKNAFNADGSANDYYSSLSDSKFLSQTGNLLLQYNRSEGQDRDNLQFGVQLNRALNETYTRSYGVDKTTGAGEWYTDWSPYLRMSFNRKNGLNLSFNYSGGSSQPSPSRMLPVLDLSNPTQLSLGNIYLQPGFRHNIGTNLSYSNPAKQSSIGMHFNLGMRYRAVTTASWFDDDLIRYSIPVPTRKPAVNASFSLSFNTPLNASKTLMLSGWGYGMMGRIVGYQSVSSFGSLDTKAFDYTEFMSRFWGDDASGETFYSGASGFSESLTRTLTSMLDFELTWKPGQNWEIATGTSADLSRSRYSLDERANTFTRKYTTYVELEYTTPHGWQFGTDVYYDFYRGYAEGYDKSHCKWDFTLNKNIKQFGFSFMIKDILNQARDINHKAAENYVEDSYRYILGRYFLLSFTWNFGKMGATQSQRAQSAMWNMLF